MSKRWERIERALSSERLSPYRAHTGGDPALAIALYEWNAAASAAVWLDIANVEVLVRNALHTQLAAWSLATHGHSRWHEDPGRVLAPRRRDDIAEACQRLRRAGKQPEPGRVVAELGFGFWRYLLASHYDRTLWVPALRKGFPGQQRRRPLYDRLARLHLLRNRVAHHEPIHHLPLLSHLADILTVVEWIDPALRPWVEAQSQTKEVVAQRPSGHTITCRSTRTRG